MYREIQSQKESEKKTSQKGEPQKDHPDDCCMQQQPRAKRKRDNQEIPNPQQSTTKQATLNWPFPNLRDS